MLNRFCVAGTLLLLFCRTVGRIVVKFREEKFFWDLWAERTGTERRPGVQNGPLHRQLQRRIRNTPPCATHPAAAQNIDLQPHFEEHAKSGAL